MPKGEKRFISSASFSVCGRDATYTFLHVAINAAAAREDEEVDSCCCCCLETIVVVSSSATTEMLVSEDDDETDGDELGATSVGFCGKADASDGGEVLPLVAMSCLPNTTKEDKRVQMGSRQAAPEESSVFG